MSEYIPVVASDIHGSMRLYLLRLHRLLEFERTFNDYLIGRATAEDVKRRGKLMIKTGLPMSLK